MKLRKTSLTITADCLAHYTADEFNRNYMICAGSGENTMNFGSILGGSFNIWSFYQRVPVRVRTTKDPHWSRKFPMKMLLLGSCQRTVDAKQTVHLQFLRDYQLIMLGFKRMLVYSLLFRPLLLFQLQL